jgi:DNA (cytosine-5)-methyltransferase 1
VIDERPTHIDLFSGIGGFALAAERVGWRTIAFCEKNNYCRKILKKHWAEVPIINEIRNFKGHEYEGCSLITGGFPCQCFSNSGKKLGSKDDRYLWPEMFRIIKEAKPCFVVAENVTGIINMALDNVLSDLEAEGYSTGSLVIGACSLNAIHKRQRVWILAHTNSKRGCGRKLPRQNANDAGESPRSPLSRFWDSESPFCRVANGIPDKTHRIAALGNAIVPGIAEEILRSLMKSYEARR